MELRFLIKAHPIHVATFGPANKVNLTKRWILEVSESLGKESTSENMNITNASESIILEVPQKILIFPFSEAPFKKNIFLKELAGSVSKNINRPSVTKIINLASVFKTRRGSPVDHRPSTAEAPPTGKIHPFSKMAVTFEPLMRF